MYTTFSSFFIYLFFIYIFLNLCCLLFFFVLFFLFHFVLLFFSPNNLTMVNNGNFGEPKYDVTIAGNILV